MKCIILTEGSFENGLGHIIRSKSICEAFNQFNISCFFIINGDVSVNKIFNDEKYIIDNWLVNYDKYVSSKDIVLIDSYLADENIYKEISKIANLCIYIDDNNRLNYPEGILVNGTIFAEKFNFNGNYIKLLGSSYIPLRKNFWNNYVYKIKNFESILITLGGSDFRNLTPSILKSINKSYPQLNKKVVIGASFTNIDEIIQEKDENTEFIFNASSEKMINLMLNSDLAISSAGGTLYELAKIGVPTIAICIADNQKNNIKNWSKQGFITYIGSYNDENLLKNLNDKIELFKNDIDLRINKSQKGKKAVDGKGTLKIVKKTLFEYYTKNSKLRKATYKDVYKIYEISNDKDVRKSSFNSDKIELETHKKWFKNILHDKNIIFLVLEYQDEIIGQVRFKLIDNDLAEISISLNKKFRSLGLSTYLLKEAMDFVEINTFISQIKKENVKSINLFEKLGFKYNKTIIVNDIQSLEFKKVK